MERKIKVVSNTGEGVRKRAALTRKGLQAEVKNSRSMKSEKEVIRERCIDSGGE